MMKEVIKDNYQLYNGDCIEVMKSLIKQKIKVDAIITDPPYGTTKCDWDLIIPFDKMWKCIFKLRRDTTPILLFGSEPFSSYLRLSNIKEFKYDWIWKKSKTGSALLAKYRPMLKHEIISVFYKQFGTYNPQMKKGKPYTRHLDCKNKPNNHKWGIKEVNVVNKGVRYPISVQFFRQKWRRQDQVHPTQKPIKLMEYFVKTYTNPGDVVLDFTMGSGTTGVACLKHNRKFIGIELNKDYYKIAKQRLKEVDNGNRKSK